MQAVLAALRACGVCSVLDLGCGSGRLVARLAREPGVRRIVGVDASGEAIRAAEDRLRADRLRADGAGPGVSVTLLHASFTEPDPRLAGFDAAAMVETIEHVDPDRLSAVERAVFACYRPGVVVMTTPNREYNGLLGVPGHRLRHPDHRFEWTRARFRSWAAGVAGRNGYAVAFADIGDVHPSLGGATQMAVFARDTAAHLGREG